MSRLEKKCFVGAAAMHGLLIVTFLASSAFLTSQPQITAASVITILPPDTKAFGKADGNPDPPAAAVAKVQPPQPTPEPPKPVQPVIKPEPVKPPEVVKAPEKNPEPIKNERGDLPIKPVRKQEVVQKETATKSSLLTPARKTNELAKLQREKEAKAAQEADRKYKQELAKWSEQRGQALAAAKEAVGGVREGLSKSGVATPVGTSLSGGTVVGSYGERLKAVYDARWTLGHDLADDESAASVSVVVARDGTVKSHRIIKPSGNSAFDRSVRQVLETVRSAPPFPSEMKDAEREFTWKFERKLRAG
jgi:colicin import membrane protein